MTYTRASDSATLGVAPPAARVTSLIDRCAENIRCRRVIAGETSVKTARHWLAESHLDADLSPLPQPFHVWVWLEYRGSIPRHIRLNLRALRRHAPASATITILNASTVTRWVALPAEFHRLRHRVAASDVARVALLATHGGLYLDADVLVAEPLAPVLALLHEYESVVYASWGQECLRGHFSANFVATRPNTTLWSLAWARLQAGLQETCRRPSKDHKPNMKLARGQIACCFDGQGSQLAECQTTWALTDAAVRPVAESLALAESLSLYCLQGLQSLTPRAGSRPGHFSPLEEACVNQFHLPTRTLGGCEPCRIPNAFTEYTQDGKICCAQRGHDLECFNGRNSSKNKRGGRALSVKYFDRVAYHLFESINGPTFARHRRIEQSNLSVGVLYRRALGL